MDVVDGSAPVVRVVRRVRRGVQTQTRKRSENYFVDPKAIRLPKLVELGGEVGEPKPTVTIAFISLPRLRTTECIETCIATCGGICKEEGMDYADCFTELAERACTEANSEGRSCQKGLDYEALGRALARWPEVDWDKRWNEYKGAIDEALRTDNADVVVVNELGIPIASDYPPDEFFTELETFAKKPAVIIAGSFHDARTQLNTGYIFTPQPGFEVIPFHKQVTAGAVGEHISVSGDRHSVVVKAFDLNIGVVICADLLDHSSIAPLVALGGDIDFVLVPAHSPSVELLEKTACALSKVMPGGVGVVNYAHQMKHYGSMHMFGVYIDPTKERLLQSGAGLIRTYELDMVDFTTRKRHLKVDDSDFAWMLRQPRILIAG